MDTNRLETYFFLLLLFLALVLMAFMFLQYLQALILAFVFAVIMKPIYLNFNRWFGGQKSIAAIASVLLLIVIVFAPLIILSIKIFQEGTSLYLTLLDNRPGLGGALAQFENYLQNLMPGIKFNFGEYLRQIVSWLLENISFIFTGLAQAIFVLFLGLLGFYYLLKDGDKFEARLISFLPLSQKYSGMIWERLNATVNSVIKGSLLIAVIQGVLTGIGFAIFGVPSPAFWGLVTVFAALVPTLGTSLVIAPAVIYLFFSHSFAQALGLIIWGVIAVGLIDNFLAPQFIKRGTKIHPFLILLSVLGGLSLMGPIGFLAGPLVLSMFFALLDIYSILILKRE